jgi:predicted phage tail protein
VRGTATDEGCANGFVARVQISISHKAGKRCQFVTAAARLSKKKSCSKPHWLTAAGTATWSKRIPKRLARGTYRLLTRAVDSAGNVERAHARLFRIPSTKRSQHA